MFLVIYGNKRIGNGATIFKVAKKDITNAQYMADCHKSKWCRTEKEARGAVVNGDTALIEKYRSI